MAYNAKIEDVEQETGFKTDTIYRWCRSGFIPHVAVGQGRRKYFRFDLAEIRMWMEAQKQPGRLERVPHLEV